MHILLFKVFHKIGLSKHMNAIVTSTYSNKKVRIPVLGNLGYNNTWHHEPWMPVILAKLAPFFKGNFFDIGVNTGQTLIAAKSVFNNFDYYGFEPNSSCVAYVNKLVKANKWQGVTIFPVGIGENASIKKLDFFYEDEIDPAATMIENFRPSQPIDHSIFVPCFSFEQISTFVKMPNDSIIKIDVEGAELEVIRGLKEALLTHRPFVVIEILPIYSSENISRLTRQDELEAILKESSYCILQIDTRLATLRPMDTIGVSTDIDYVDYILAPVEKKGALLQAFN